MITEDITLLEFINKHLKHYDYLLKREEYDSLEIKVKGGQTGRMIIRRTSPYELTHNPKHKKYQEIKVNDTFELEVDSNSSYDCLTIKPYILLWASGR